MIDLDGPDPLRAQIASVLRGRIVSGEYQVNRRIPSEAELSDEFGVSRNSVRAAIKLLTDDGILRSVRGRGTFVVRQP